MQYNTTTLHSTAHTACLRLAAVLTTLLLTIIVHAADVPPLHHRQFTYHHLGMAEGLQSTRAFSIVQDEDGAMWIATRVGVDRYNGHTVQNYTLPSPGKHSEGADRNISLAQGPKGLLLAYDNKGRIYQLDRRQGRFTQILDADASLGGAILNHVHIADDSTLWLSLNKGLCRLTPSSQAGATYTITDNDILLRSHFVNRTVALGSTLAACATDGLYIYNKENHSTTARLQGQNIVSLWHDAKTHRAWVGTFANGVAIYHTDTWQPLPSPGLASLPHVPVRALQPLTDHTMLLGLDGAGVYAASLDGADCWPLMNADDNTGEALHGNGIYDICRDRSGNIWVASYSGGIDMASPTAGTAVTMQHEYLNAQSLLNNNVNAVTQTADGTMWYATDLGVSIFSPTTMRWTHGRLPQACLTLCPSKEGGVLVGTYGGGVYHVTASGATSRAFSVEQGNLRSNYVYSLFSDRDHELWIGCLDGPLTYVGRSATRTYPIDQVYTIAAAPDGRIAVGTGNGFHLINKHNGHTTHHFAATGGADDTENHYLQAIHFASNDHVWLATDGGGLYLYQLSTRSIKRNITTADGLPSNTVYSLTTDTRNRLWASTHRGLALLRLDAKEGQHTVVNVNHLGTLQREYKRMAVATMADGRLAYGSTSGAVMVNPADMGSTTYEAPLRITSLTLPEAEADTTGHLRTLLHDGLEQGTIELSYSQGTFAINFESINYRFQHDIVYQYMLEDFDPTWSEPSKQQSAQYTNLPPGTYRFHVRAISNGSGRTVSEQSLTIVVHQPWWNTWWAWLLWLSMVGAALFAAWRLYRNRLEQRYYDEKINFFVHTAHDIRTPLSLTLAPLDDIDADPSLSPDSRRYLDLARSNGRKLLAMLTQLLDFQKQDTTNVPLNPEHINVGQMLRIHIDSFQAMAAQHHLQLTMAHCPDDLIVLMDPDMASAIMDNLLSNAVKYTPDGGTITLSAERSEGRALIHVADTGIGIPAKAHPRIFQNFYRADNAVNSQQTGSGIGLMYTKRLVERHGGQLTFVSEEGKGSTFTISIPAPSDSPMRGREEITSEGSGERSDSGERDERDVLLFVDDNAELRQYMLMAFSAHYRVVAKSSADEALAYLKDGECDIVVSDVMMPGMQGDELCRHIKQDPQLAYLPVILLTAKQGRDFMIEGLNLGADDYVTKPFDRAVLQSRINTLLSNRRRMAEHYMGKAKEMAGTGTATAPSDSPVRGREGITTEGGIVATELPEPSASPTDTAFIEKATQLVLDNLSDTDFTIDSLCREMAMSRTLFYGRLKTLTGSGPQEFMRTIRLERAAALLREGHSVLDVSVKTGFVNVKYFSTLFKKQYGVSPSKFE